MVENSWRGSRWRRNSRINDDAYRPAGSTTGTQPAWANPDIVRPANSAPHNVDVLVIGAGQAGLAAAHALLRRGFTGYTGSQDPRGVFLILDAEVRPGGAWQHRWPTLTMETVNHIADLPGMPVGPHDPQDEAAEVVPEYFTEYEEAFDLPILRPVLVFSVEENGDGRLCVESSAGTYIARAIINCTGTWTRPFVPYYPGVENFRGSQFHTQGYSTPERFWRQRVMIVGGGISALNHLAEVSEVAKKVHWVTRTPPRWREWGGGTALPEDIGREVENRVRARVEAGLRPQPVVAETGIPLTPKIREMQKRGLLDRKPMFDRLEAHGAVWGETFVELDSIIWATGFRPELRHLAPLRLRTPMGGVKMEGTHVAGDPRIHLIGYGPSASTVGARRDSRIAVRDIISFFGDAGAPLA